MIACEYQQEAFMHARPPLGIIILVPDDGIGKCERAKV